MLDEYWHYQKIESLLVYYHSNKLFDHQKLRS